MQITIPDELTDQLQQLATIRRQPVEQLVMERLQQLLDTSLSQLPTAEQAELEALPYLSEDALRAIATEQMPDEAQARVDTLLAGNRQGVLTTEENAELVALVERGDQLMLRKAEALLLLKRRGHTMTKEHMMSSDD